MSEHGGVVDGGGDDFELGGGPLLPGRDYEDAWLGARVHADRLNSVLSRLGFTGDLVLAQAGWMDDGRGVVRLRCTPLGAYRLARVLECLDAHRSAA